MFEVRLLSLCDLSPTTREFVFTRVDEKATPFSAGQFFRFDFEDELGNFERSYSLCNFEENTLSGVQQLKLVISQVNHGRATKLLFKPEAELVDKLSAAVTGPFGRLVLPEVLPRRICLVATSVGLAPFLPILAQLQQELAAGSTEVHLVLGVRDVTELLYGDLLKNFARRYESFHLHICYSRQTLAARHADEPRQSGSLPHHEHYYEGYVQEALPVVAANPATDLWYLCGNPLMVDQVYRVLKEQNCGVRQVIREKYVFARRSISVGGKTTEGVASTPKAMNEEQKRLLAEKMKKYQS